MIKIVYLFVSIVIVYMILRWIKSKIYFHPDKSPCDLDNLNSNEWYIQMSNMFDLSDLEDVFIGQNKDNGFIHGWLLSNKNENEKSNRKLIIVSHGNAGCLLDRCALVKQLGRNFDADIFCYDYSGYGSTTRKYWILSEKTLQSDCLMVIQHFINIGYSKDNIILYGESIGAPITCYCAHKMTINKVILQSGPASMADVADTYVKGSLLKIASLLAWNDFSTKNYLKKLKKHNENAKVIVLHSKTDDIVNYKNGKILEHHGGILIDIEGIHNDTKISSNVWNLIKEKLL